MAGRGDRRLSCKWVFPLLALLACSALHAQTGGTVTYVYTDPQGTPLAEADANGNITKTFDYTPYGTTALGTPPSGPGYTGHVNDPETNLVYMQARYYDPATGHFLSVDPVAPAAANTFNFNRFDYANNNPIANTDPTGRQCAQCLYSPGTSVDQQASINAGASKKALAMTAIAAPLVPGAAFVGATTLAVAGDAIATGSITSGILLNGPSVVASGSMLAEGVAAANGVAAPISPLSLVADGEMSLSASQTSNLNRFNKSLPAASTGTSVDSLGSGIVFTSTVPGNVPGSSAVYQKTVDSSGQTSSFLKLHLHLMATSSILRTRSTTLLFPMISDIPMFCISGDEKMGDLLTNIASNERIYLSRDALALLLQRYVDNNISSEALVELANILEMNEHINVDQLSDDVINNVLFQLANPEINGHITIHIASSLIDSLIS